jgi:hypothetical protein
MKSSPPPPRFDPEPFRADTGFRGHFHRERCLA